MSSHSVPAPPPRLLDRLRTHLCTHHYTIRTEEAYVDWARRFILFHGKRHPQDMGAPEVEAFLRHLAVDRQVPASTQNQARAALLYPYKQVLQVDLPWPDEVVQALGVLGMNRGAARIRGLGGGLLRCECSQ